MSVHVGGERRFLLLEFERENLRFLLSLSLSLLPTNPTLTDLVVPAVEHVTQLHHDGVPAAPGRAGALVLREHAGELERRDRLAEVAVDVADCRRE